ncbi:MAG: asparagine synthase (glutamine-hydrolyzing) [bacterium]|nr:asparagine synthase (glutamine-hydrolyzing) [bacterium]
MCSINGFNFIAPELILKMNQETSHRGPDDTGTWQEKGITLGHNRLSIIDLSPRGAQPMTDCSGRLTITFNGEIYNYRELREELRKKYTFRSESDTEVILNAYLEYGKECVKKFNGIFALAIHDVQTGELFLARDQSGVKPLYYFWDPSTGSTGSPQARSGRARFIFSSEIKAILEHNIPREVDREAFNLYMRMLYVPEPYTMFKGIKKLPPAHYAVLKGNKLDIQRYWEVTDFSDISSKEEATKMTRTLFDDSVRRQLISDRPVGIFLSGGIDSSAVLGAAARTLSGQIKTYSVGFDVEVQREKFNADFLLARKTAETYKTDHHELTISGKDIGDVLPKIAWHLDEPNANPTAGAIYLLSQMAKKDVAIVLGGDGADELFGGYLRYARSRAVRRLSQFPFVGQLLRLVGKEEVVQKLHQSSIGLFLSFMAQKERDVTQILAQHLRNSTALYEHFSNYLHDIPLSSDYEKHFMNTDRQSWLVDESLLRSDKMTMAFGLEERVPILDYRLVELAARIPTAWKIKGSGMLTSSFQGKQIWKEAIRSYLPEHILSEEKRGWFTPMAKWLRSELKEQVEEILSPNHLNSEFFNVQAVQSMWHAHLESRKYNLNLIWAIVMWQLWYDTFIRNS